MTIETDFKWRMTVDYLLAVIFCFADMLDKDHLASTVCTILDWHIMNVAGMWIFHPVNAIHLAQEIIDSTGIESLVLQAFKKERWWASINLPSRSNYLSWHIQINVEISNEESQRQWSIFWSGTYTWWSSRKSPRGSRNAPINKLSRSKALKTQQVEHGQRLRKTSDFSSFHRPRRYVSTHKIFAYLDYFAKVSVSICAQGIIDSTGTKTFAQYPSL